MAFVNFTKEEFRTRYGYDLDQIVPDDHDPSSKVDRAIADVTELIQEYILAVNPGYDFTEVTTEQNTYINKACMEQLVWHSQQADFSRNAGYNAATEVYQSMPEIRKRVIAPNALRILNNHIICRSFS